MKVAVFIFSSGKGVRLQPYTLRVPKPLLPIDSDNSCMLDRILNAVVTEHLNDVFINYSYGKEAFEKVVNKYTGRAKVTLINDESILGQGGILLESRSMLMKYDYILCLNGDTFVRTDYENLLVKNLSDFSLFLSDSKEEKAKPNLFMNEFGQLVGYESPSRGDSYFYRGVTSSELFSKKNYLGVALIPTKSLQDIDYGGDFLGFFGRDDLFERMFVKGFYTKSFESVIVDKFITMDTCEEYERILKENGCTRPILHF